MFGVASELPQQNQLQAQSSQRQQQAIIACQVCGQDQTLTDSAVTNAGDTDNGAASVQQPGRLSSDEQENQQATDSMYIMECCFSIVCKDCIGVTSNCSLAQQPAADSNDAAKAQQQDNGDAENSSRRTTPTETKTNPSNNGGNNKAKICLACLEPISVRSGSGGTGMQALSFQKNSVLVNLLSSINEANKQVVAAYQQSQAETRSSIFNFITGSNSATSQLENTMCHRCQEREQRFVCETCNSGSPADPSSKSTKPMKLCQECNTVIHSLGKAFMAHKVSECVEFNGNTVTAGSAVGGSPLGSGEKIDGANGQAACTVEQQRMLLQKLVKLEECPKHAQPIEYYLDEEVSEDAPFELSGVTYGCQRCLTSAEPSTQANFTRIDKDNLLNVYQLKQELFKERQKAQTTLGSMLSTYNLDIVQKLPELRTLECQNLNDVVTRCIKTLQNKQKEIEEQIEHRFQKLTDHVYKEKQRMLTKKEVIERNYNLLEKALDVIPLQILSCEEGLLEAMLMANSELMKVMRSQESKLNHRQSMYIQLQKGSDSGDAENKFEPPFHLIDPVQQKQRLSQLEQFASKIDSTISDLFKHASDQLEKRQDVVVLAQQHAVPHSMNASNSLQAYNPLTSQSSPHFRPGAIGVMNTLDSSQAALQTYHTNASNSTGNIQQVPGFATSSDVPAQIHHLSNSQMQSSEEAITLTGSAAAQALPPGSADHPKRGEKLSQNVTSKSGMSAFLTKQDQASKSRMDRNNMAKSHLSIGKTQSNNQLDVTPDQSTKPSAKIPGAGDQSKTQKGGTSRREQSYNAKAAGGEIGVRGSSQSAVAAHQAYLVSQSANQRYMNNAVSKSSAGLKTSVANKWDSSTRVINKSKQRDASVNSNSQAQTAQQNQGQSLPRSGSYMNQAAKDRSMNRGSLNVSQNARQGAHSTVGLSERWAANATNKRSSNLNISQDMSGAANGELINQKDRNGEHSPRVSRNRINMNNLAKPERGVSQVGGLDPEKQAIKDNMAQIESNCLLPRVFTHVAQTSTAIQVAWSHPSNFQKIIQTTDDNGQTVVRKQHIQYVLEYGIGVKVDNKEQFRQIYKGKAHKCIITDLMPRTTFRLRVAPILNMEKSLPIENKDQGAEHQNGEASKKTVVTQEQGQWSEVTNITTKETQTFDVGGALSSSNPKAPNLMCAQLQTKGRKKWLNFDKAGTLLATYGYSFGEHLWCLKIQYQEAQQQMQISGNGQASSALDQSGSMVIGVVNKRFSNQKMFGSVINYSLFKGEIVVKIYLDSNKKRLIIYSPQHPQGDVFSDLPKDGLFFPAVQNKTAVSKQKSSLRVYFKFDQLIPKDKGEIGASLIYSSGDDGADNTNDDLSQNASMHGGTMNQSINSSSMMHHSQHHQQSTKEEGKAANNRRAMTKQPTPLSEKQQNNGSGGGTFSSQHQQYHHQSSQSQQQQSLQQQPSIQGAGSSTTTGQQQERRMTTVNSNIRFNSAATLSTITQQQQNINNQNTNHNHSNNMKDNQITQNINHHQTLD